MTLFYACFTEPDGPDSAELITQHFDDHKAWLRAHEGDIFVAGPLLTDTLDYAGTGLIVLRADSLDAARALAGTDPMHEHGARRFRIVPWRLNEGTVSTRATLSAGTFELS